MSDVSLQTKYKVALAQIQHAQEVLAKAVEILVQIGNEYKLQ